jgi:hypothetical protein
MSIMKSRIHSAKKNVQSITKTVITRNKCINSASSFTLWCDSAVEFAGIAQGSDCQMIVDRHTELAI